VPTVDLTERLRVLEAVASTQRTAGGGAATSRATRGAVGDVSARLCFDSSTAAARVCLS
jgi:hypothetical protein